METVLQRGNILTMSSKDYRILYVEDDYLVLIEMETDKLNVFQIPVKGIVEMIRNNSAAVKESMQFPVDRNNLPETYQDKLNLYQTIVLAVDDLYGPSYMELTYKRKRPELQNVMQEAGVSKKTFWRILRVYLQSGFKIGELADGRSTTGRNKKIYEPGEKSKLFHTLTYNDRLYMTEALKEYKSGKSMQQAYDYMCGKHYTTSIYQDDGKKYLITQGKDKPSFNQFQYFVRTNTSVYERKRTRKKARELRNNERVFIGDATNDVYGPGGMVEIDACEADMALVSSFDRNLAIGRPTIYTMLDVYTRMILAVSVELEVNSVIGITNCLLNLAEDKNEFAGRYGVHLEREWISGILPRAIRTDRGSDFQSDKLETILNRLGIRRELAPPAMGSLKPHVESLFGSLTKSSSPFFKKQGLITKDPDNDHHAQATLTLEEYTAIVLQFVAMHNANVVETYNMTEDMVKCGVKPIPYELWKYGCEKFGNPRLIMDIEQYRYDLLIDGTCSVNKKHIKWNGLLYEPDQQDLALLDRRIKTQNKVFKLPVRYDERNVDTLFYQDDSGQMRCLRLSKKFMVNKGMEGRSLQYVKECNAQRRKLRKEAKETTAEVRIRNIEANAAIMQAAKRVKTGKAETKNMRLARSVEKELNRTRTSIGPLIEPETEIMVDVEETTVEKKPIAEKKNNRRAIEAFMDDRWED